jgi:hypothetical protein
VTLKSLVSEMWNSYVFAPEPLDVPLRTVSVGRSVSSCASETGESGTGAVKVGAPEGPPGVGADGLDDPPHATANTANATHTMRQNDVMQKYYMNNSASTPIIRKKIARGDQTGSSHPFR